MARTSKAGVMAAGAIGFLGASILLGGMFPSVEPELVILGVIGYLACGARAMTLWRAGEQVFERRRTARHPIVIQRGELDRVSQSRTHLHVRTVDRVRGLLDQER